MGMQQIRESRGVPAKRGMRVRYTGAKDGDKLGTITTARGGYVQIRLDGEKHVHSYHPTWELDYLDDSGAILWSYRRDRKAIEDQRAKYVSGK